MLRFALQRIRLPLSTVNFLISLFTKRINRVFTAHGVTPAYRVRIGIDQGEVISPLLWVIYIDLLLTVLKNEMNNPYVLSATSLSASQPPFRIFSTLSPIIFNLTLSNLNRIPSISITPISMTTSFRFLGVWFNINSTRDFVRNQVKRECNSFTATVLELRTGQVGSGNLSDPN
ncbi:unnamed protein product [Rhizophagus irregularis]|nr:unnamed protein product [Rhizophagus irregularis]